MRNMRARISLIGYFLFWRNLFVSPLSSRFLKINMLLTTLLAVAPFAAAPQLPIDATMDTQRPAVQLGNGGFGTQATGGFDNFDRADSGDLGAGWTLDAGSIGIVSNRAQGFTNLSMATINGVNDNYATSTVSAKVDNGGAGLSYIALMAGVADADNGIFVKLQDNNSDSLMDRVFFYYGNTFSNWGSTTYYWDLAVPTATATVHLTFDMGGDRAVFTVENDTSGNTEVFYGDNVLSVAGGLGTGFAIGTYGIATADDFTVNEGGAQMQLSASGTPGSVMSFDVATATPGSTVAIIWSFSLGNYIVPNSFPCGGTELGLGNPAGWTFVNANASGLANLTRFVPARAAGRVHVQALDLASCGLSNVLSL